MCPNIPFILLSSFLQRVWQNLLVDRVMTLYMLNGVQVVIIEMRSRISVCAIQLSGLWCLPYGHVTIWFDTYKLKLKNKNAGSHLEKWSPVCPLKHLLQAEAKCLLRIRVVNRILLLICKPITEHHSFHPAHWRLLITGGEKISRRATSLTPHFWVKLHPTFFYLLFTNHLLWGQFN